MYICMYIPPVALWDHYKTSWNRETICRESVLEQVGLSPIWQPITDLVHTPFNRGQWDWKRCIIIRKRVHTRSELKQGCTKTNSVRRMCPLVYNDFLPSYITVHHTHVFSLSLYSERVARLWYFWVFIFDLISICFFNYFKKLFVHH